MQMHDIHARTKTKCAIVSTFAVQDKQKVMKTRLRYRSQRVTKSVYKQRVVKTRLRYRSERVTGSKMPADDL